VTDLVLGAGFKIDANVATRRTTLLGQPDAGKTNGLTVIAEGLLKIGIPLTGLDWKGDLWGWRSGADGEAAGGFPVVIFGGDHADVDIEESDGREIGHLVADDDLPSIIDLSAFVTDTARRRFATAFLKAFLQAKRTNRAIHPLLFDEYQEFAPERPYGEGVELLAATQQVVGLGRKRGIGVLGTSLRAAQLNKSVLELTDLYLFMQVAGKNDLASIVDTVRPRASAEELEALRRGIPRLGKGEVYAYSPAWLRILEKRRFRLRETFDSSRTPEIGDADVPEPKAFAEINAPALAARIVATREARAADDPDKLRAEIAKLRAQLAERLEASEPIIETVTVEKPVLSEADLAVMRDVVARADAIVESQRILEASVESVRNSVDRLRETVAPVASALGLQRTFDALMVGVRSGPAAEAVVEPAVTTAAANAQPARKRRQSAVLAAASAVASSPVSATAPPNGLGGGHMRVLEALALRHPAVSTRVQTAVLAGYSPSGGGFANYLGALRSKGLIDYPSSGTVALTAEGAKLMKSTIGRAPMSSPELLAMWLGRVGSAARVLDVVAGAYPSAIPREEVAKRVGMSVGGGGFANYLGRLRSLGLIEYVASGVVKASDELFAVNRK